MSNPVITISVADTDWEIRILQGDLVTHRCRNGLAREYFSIPLTLKSARELRDLFDGYLKVLEVGGILV